MTHVDVMRACKQCTRWCTHSRGATTCCDRHTPFVYVRGGCSAHTSVCCSSVLMRSNTPTPCALWRLVRWLPLRTSLHLAFASKHPAASNSLLARGVAATAETQTPALSLGCTRQLQGLSAPAAGGSALVSPHCHPRPPAQRPSGPGMMEVAALAAATSSGSGAAWRCPGV